MLGNTSWILTLSLINCECCDTSIIESQLNTVILSYHLLNCAKKWLSYSTSKNICMHFCSIGHSPIATTLWTGDKLFKFQKNFHSFASPVTLNIRSVPSLLDLDLGVPLPRTMATSASAPPIEVHIFVCMPVN